MRAGFLPPLFLLCGCAGTPSGPPSGGSGAMESGALAFVSPAKWDYHPGAPDTIASALVLDGGACILTAPGGQRWLVTPEPGAVRAQKSGRARCAGRAEAAHDLAPEDLLAIFRSPSGSPAFSFIGESGAIHEAESPLGPFTRSRPSKTRYSRVSGSKNLLLGATSDGKVHRWEAGSGFRPVAPLPARIFDVAVDERGRGLALAFPEALFTSIDGGATWVSAPAPPIGARRLGVTANGELAAAGVFESLVFGDPAKPPTRLRKAVLQNPVQTDLDVGRAPSALAVRDGRAGFDGERYVELIPPSEDDKPWTIARGKIDGRLETVKTPALGCASARVALRASTIFLACSKADPSDQMILRLRRSLDFGTTWSDPLELRSAEAEIGFMAVSPLGSALLVGTCVALDAQGTCKPVGPVLVRAEGAQLRGVLAAAPQLDGGAVLPAFSFDGRAAYFLGKREKDERVTLFVSHDAAETFSPRPLSAPPKPTPEPKRNDDADDESPPEPPSDGELEVDPALGFVQTADDGTIGLMLRGRSDLPVYVLTDEDGRVLQRSQAPDESATIAGFGRRLVAIGPQPGSDDRPVSNRESASLWESSDGGATWEERPAPLALAREGPQPVTCAAAGCLFGEWLTRIGWGGAIAAAEPAQTDKLPRSEPKVRTSISCELAPGTRWTRIDNVHGAGFPSFHDVMRGRSVWSVVTEDRQTGALGTVSAMLPDSGDGPAQVVQKQLLGGGGGGHFASLVSHQIEGYVVARAPYPVDAKGDFKPGSPMKNIEIAWENYLEGTSGRARIADAGVFEKGDLAMQQPSALLRMGLVTISVRSVYVRPHHAASKDATVFFFDASGRAHPRFTFPEVPKKTLLGDLSATLDAATIDDKPFLVLLLSGSNATSTVVLARRASPGSTSAIDGWDMTATSIAPTRGDDGTLVRTGWSYLGKSTIGLVSLVADPRNNQGWAYFDPFRADGTALPPQPVPTVLDLPERPKPCSLAERQTTARIEALSVHQDQIFFPGTRHPLLIHEPATKGAAGVSVPSPLLTVAAVMHGSPAAPCVAAWEARSLKNGPPMAAVVSGDLTRSWAFRPGGDRAPNARRPSASSTAIEARPMSCRYDPTASFPDAVWNEPGTARYLP